MSGHRENSLDLDPDVCYSLPGLGALQTRNNEAVMEGICILMSSTVLRHSESFEYKKYPGVHEPRDLSW